MLKIEKIYPRDIIAIVVLIISLGLISLGINLIVSGIVIMIITFYFSRRVNGEGEPSKDINNKVKKLETQINGPKVMMAKFADVPKPNPIPQEPLTTGDFKPVPKTSIPH